MTYPPEIPKDIIESYKKLSEAKQKRLENWLDVSITCALQTLARTFTVSATRDKEDLTLGVKPGDSVQVFIGEDRVLTGYITKREVSYNASGSSIRISGARKRLICRTAACRWSIQFRIKTKRIFRTCSRCAEPMTLRLWTK